MLHRSIAGNDYILQIFYSANVLPAATVRTQKTVTRSQEKTQRHAQREDVNGASHHADQAVSTASRRIVSIYCYLIQYRLPVTFLVFDSFQ